MENNFFYPGAKVSPVAIDDGYRDYRLSAILAAAGIHKTIECELRFARNELSSDNRYAYMIAIAHLTDGKCMVLAPRYYWSAWGPNHSRIIEAVKDERELATPLERYGDLRIRYYINNGIVQRPVWESAYGVGKRFFKKDADGKDRLFYPEVELLSGHQPIPNCYEILQWPLVVDDDEASILALMKRSPYIDYFE